MDNAPRWIEYDTYYMLVEGKVKRRLTGHRFGAAAGHTQYATRDQTADEMADIVQKVVTEQDQINMNRGIAIEPIAIEWYEKQRNVKVKPLKLCIPKWDKELGCIPDGDVNGEGLISIKGPDKMYKSLDLHVSKISQGWVPTQDYHSHIWTSHYDQMQGEMAILNRPWCDYIVYAIGSDRVYTERVYRNASYWKDELYPLLVEFKEKYLKPRSMVIEIPSFNLLITDKCKDSS